MVLYMAFGIRISLKPQDKYRTANITSSYRGLQILLQFFNISYCYSKWPLEMKTNPCIPMLPKQNEAFMCPL